MLLAAELLLLALDPDRGTVVNGAKQQLTVGLCGALVSELALDGAVDVDGKRFVALGPTPADPLLASVHAALAAPSSGRAADQLRRLDRRIGGVWPVLVDRMVGERLLGRRADRYLFVTLTRHPVLQPHVRGQVLARIRAAAAGDGPLDPRTAVVLALAGPSRLLEVVAPERATRRHARDRIAAASELTPVAPVVRKVIASAQVAVAAGVAAAGAISSS